MGSEPVYCLVLTLPLLVWDYDSMDIPAFVAGTSFWFTFRDRDTEEEKLIELYTGDGASRRVSDAVCAAAVAGIVGGHCRE